MRDLSDVRVGPCRTVGDPPGESLWLAFGRAARELGPLFDLGGYSSEAPRCENCNAPAAGWTEDDVALCAPCAEAIEEEARDAA